jgi:hypothetical protein
MWSRDFVPGRYKDFLILKLLISMFVNIHCLGVNFVGAQG